jgi:predicted secreted protein
MKQTVFLFIIWIFSCSNCKAMKPDTVITIVLSQGKQKATITAHKGDILLVKLPMASGTGFVWEVGPDKLNLCKQGDTKYEHIKRSMPGSPLMEVINLNITASGIEDISFIYHRPFEKNTAPAKTKQLHLMVQ